MTPSTPRRVLGALLEVSAVGLGCMGFTLPGVRVDEEGTHATIRRFLDRGGSLVDTADMYGRRLNETLVGRAIRGRRDEVVLATKFGFEWDEDGTVVGVNGHADYVRRSCDASLTALGVDHIDLYYQHRVDRGVPVEETWGAMSDLVAAGKVRALGISEASPATIRRAHAVHPVTAVQTEWSLWTRDVEANGIRATTRELRAGFVPYSPMGRGMLSGSLRSRDDLDPSDYRRGLPRFSEDHFDVNRELVGRIEALAAQKGVTPAQLALAWLLGQGDDVVPIPGTTRLAHLEENMAAADIVLTVEEQLQVASALPMGSAQGSRYGDMSSVDG
jgi:aryl-alcohol dehydrogenase-like predicted oxidoreductase